MGTIFNILIIGFLILIGFKIMFFILSCIGDSMEEAEKENKEFYKLYGYEKENNDTKWHRMTLFFNDIVIVRKITIVPPLYRFDV